MSGRLWIWIVILIFPLIYVVSVLSTHQDVLEELQRENMEEPAPALLEAANNRLKKEGARIDADKARKERLSEEAARLNAQATARPTGGQTIGSAADKADAAKLPELLREE